MVNGDTVFIVDVIVYLLTILLLFCVWLSASRDLGSP